MHKEELKEALRAARVKLQFLCSALIVWDSEGIELKDDDLDGLWGIMECIKSEIASIEERIGEAQLA